MKNIYKNKIKGIALSSIVAFSTAASAQQSIYHYKDGDVTKKELLSNIDSVAISDNKILHYRNGQVIYEVSSSYVDSIALEPRIYLTTTEINLKSGSYAKDLDLKSSPSGEVSVSDVIWTSSDQAVAMVSDGRVTPINEGECVITGRYGSRTVSCNVKVTYSLEINGCEVVDLGLPSGTLWAKYNVGGWEPEARGKYYAWGETKEKSTYYTNSQWFGYTADQLYTKSVIDAVSDPLAKYSTGNLKSTYDAASKVWGSNWRMPTLSEFSELAELESNWVEVNGVYGREFIGNNGNTLFLPAYGWKRENFEGSNLNSDQVTGMYWTSTFFSKSEAYLLSFKKDTLYLKDYQVGYGNQIRAVVNTSSNSFALSYKKIAVHLTDGPFSLGFISLSNGTISASDVTWTSTDEDVATVSDGIVTPVGVGGTTIIAKYGSKTLTCIVYVIEEP